jgi:hypothetical protein
MSLEMTLDAACSIDYAGESSKAIFQRAHRALGGRAALLQAFRWALHGARPNSKNVDSS